MKAKPALVARVDDDTGRFLRIPVTNRRRALVFPIERKDAHHFAIVGCKRGMWESQFTPVPLPNRSG